MDNNTYELILYEFLERTNLYDLGWKKGKDSSLVLLIYAYFSFSLIVSSNIANTRTYYTI